MITDLRPKITSIPYHLTSVSTLAKYCKNITDRTQFCKIAMIGSQGTGKTSCVIDMLDQFNMLTNNNVMTIYARGNNILSLLLNVEKAKSVLQPYINNKRYIVLFLDDFSYVIETSSEIKNLIKHNYTKLRHIFKGKYLISIMTIHYKKAVQPLLRDTYIRIYTHINPEMIHDFKDNYKFSVYAKNFIRYINKYYIENKPFILECLPDETIKLNKYNNTTNANEIYKIESIALDNKCRYEENLKLIISEDNERLAIVDLGTDCKYMFYNITYNQKAEFELDNLCVITNDDDTNESFSLECDNVHKINVSELAVDDDDDEVDKRRKRKEEREEGEEEGEGEEERESETIIRNMNKQHYYKSKEIEYIVPNSNYEFIIEDHNGDYSNNHHINDYHIYLHYPLGERRRKTLKLEADSF
ncbi:MAG: hypothetical protein QXQ68_07465 [Candidatus Nitrosocaldaceae archaeon]